jgi:hypothetical protein
MWKEVVVALYKILFRNVSGGTEKKSVNIPVRIAGILAES